MIKCKPATMHSQFHRPFKINKSFPLPYVRTFSGSTFATLIPQLSSYVHLLDHLSLYSHNSLFVAMIY